MGFTTLHTFAEETTLQVEQVYEIVTGFSWYKKLVSDSHGLDVWEANVYINNAANN